MIKVKLDSLHQVQHLFSILSLPGNDLDLEKEYEQLTLIVSEKERFLESVNYSKAADLRQMELISIGKILDLLNKKGILKENVLQMYCGV